METHLPKAVIPRHNGCRSEACPFLLVGYAQVALTTLAGVPEPQRQAVKKHIMFVGLDVHKDSISIALAIDIV